MHYIFPHTHTHSQRAYSHSSCLFALEQTQFFFRCMCSTVRSYVRAYACNIFFLRLRMCSHGRKSFFARFITQRSAPCCVACPSTWDMKVYTQCFYSWCQLTWVRVWSGCSSMHPHTRSPNTQVRRMRMRAASLTYPRRHPLRPLHCGAICAWISKSSN